MPQACCSTGLAALVFPEAELHPSASRLGFLLLPPHCGAWHVCGSVHKQLKSTLNFQLLAGVDLFSLDGSRAILCQAGSATPQDAKRFLRTANCVCQAGRLDLHMSDMQRGKTTDTKTHLCAGSPVHRLDPPCLQALHRIQELSSEIRWPAQGFHQVEMAAASAKCCPSACGRPGGGPVTVALPGGVPAGVRQGSPCD